MTERQKVLVLIFQMRKLRPRERGKERSLPPTPDLHKVTVRPSGVVTASTLPCVCRPGHLNFPFWTSFPLLFGSRLDWHSGPCLPIAHV